MKKVFIFVPAFGNTLTATTFLSTHQISQVLTSKSVGASVSTLSFPDIAELRSMVATIWHDTMPDIDYLLFIDADMGVDPNMVLDMLVFDEPIVGTIYPQRKLPVSWAGSGEGSPQSERRGNFMKVEGVGMGCTLIHKSVVKTMLEKFPELADYRIDLHPAAGILRQAGANRIIRCFEKLDIPERGIVSEDLSFCIRYRRCGGQVWAAIGYDVSHVGQFDYRGNYLQHITQGAQMAEMQQKMAEATAGQQPAPTQVGWMPQPSQPPVIAPMLPVQAGGTVQFQQPMIAQVSVNGGDASIDARSLQKDYEKTRKAINKAAFGDPPKRKRGRPRKEKALAASGQSA
jgi:hypothetical protein